MPEKCTDLPWWRRGKMLRRYFFYGYFVPFVGCLITIICLCIYGSSFGTNNIVTMIGKGSNMTYGKADGPSQFYLAYYIILAIAFPFCLVSNLVGPCSFHHRSHFWIQLLNTLILAGYAASVFPAFSAWPKNATAALNPKYLFFIGSVLMFFGQCVLLFGAYSISGILRSSTDMHLLQHKFDPFGWEPKFSKLMQRKPHELADEIDYLNDKDDDDDDDDEEAHKNSEQAGEFGGNSDYYMSDRKYYGTAYGGDPIYEDEDEFDDVEKFDIEMQNTSTKNITMSKLNRR